MKQCFLSVDQEGNLLPVVEAPNFKKHVENRVKVDVGQRRTVDVGLEAGNISEVVTVEAVPLTVQLSTPTAATVISGDQARELRQRPGFAHLHPAD
jgi:hypothetical protein